MRSSPGTVHFIGICGTAMAAVAAALKKQGWVVSGSDQAAYPPMSTFLEERCIPVASGFSAENLPRDLDFVVIGNAISRGNPEVEAVLESKRPYCSLPDLLRERFIRGKRSIVVAGTHGKTTTTALLAWVFEANGLAPAFLVGGVPLNFGEGARLKSSEWFIIEGDEYDTAFFDKRSKFVHYLPDIVLLNNLEFDHADIFDDLAAIQRSFRHLLNLVPRNGWVLANGDDERLRPVLEFSPAPVRRFGLGPANDLQAQSIELTGASAAFQISGANFEIPMAGEFNLRNALGVVACARQCGLNDKQIQSAFATFKGVRRRMEVRGERDGITVIDDFGHHPTAIQQTLRALRLRYPGRRLWAVFEPRSNTTRRNVFQEELRLALAGADQVVLSQVARLELLPPEQRLDPERLIVALRTSGKEAAYLPGAPDIARHVSAHAQSGDVICVFSNGGFGGLHEALLSGLRNR